MYLVSIETYFQSRSLDVLTNWGTSLINLTKNYYLLQDGTSPPLHFHDAGQVPDVGLKLQEPVPDFPVNNRNVSETTYPANSRRNNHRQL